MVLNLRPKCANPSCAASFAWLAGGRLFRIPRHASKTSSDEVPDEVSDANAENPNPVGHFWLCERCANIYTLKFEADRGVTISPLWPELPAANSDLRLPSP